MTKLYIPRLYADARYIDALSGDFQPACDPEGRVHKLSHLAIGTVEKGRGPEDCRDYMPTWAPDTYAMVEQFDIDNSITRLTLAESAGRWPRVLRFTHAVMGLNNRHYLVVDDNRGLEVLYQLDGSIHFDIIRPELAEAAADFYAR